MISVLAKLRKELEYSRESWNVVKKKTADSEREWHSLRAEFAARRKLFKTAYYLGRGKREFTTVILNLLFKNYPFLIKSIPNFNTPKTTVFILVIYSINL